MFFFLQIILTQMNLSPDDWQIALLPENCQRVFQRTISSAVIFWPLISLMGINHFCKQCQMLERDPWVLDSFYSYRSQIYPQNHRIVQHKYTPLPFHSNWSCKFVMSLLDLFIYLFCKKIKYLVKYIDYNIFKILNIMRGAKTGRYINEGVRELHRLARLLCG